LLALANLGEVFGAGKRTLAFGVSQRIAYAILWLTPKVTPLGGLDIDLQENATMDMSSNTRGRPRAFEQARKGLMLAETVKAYAEIVPILTESGLYGALFINLYRYFRQNNPMDFFTELEKAVTGAAGKVVNLFEEFSKYSFGNGVWYLTKRQDIDNEVKTFRKKLTKSLKIRALVKLAFDNGYRGLGTATVNDENIEWNLDDASQERIVAELYKWGQTKGKVFWDNLLTSWFNGLTKIDQNPPSTKNYRMDAISAIGWAAFVVILIRSGISIGKGLVKGG